MIKKANIILVVLITLFIFSCKKDEKESVQKNGISQEIKELIYFKGDENSSVVLVNTQGGPQIELATAEFDEILQNVNTSNILRINVHQKQTLSPKLFTSNDISFNEAIGYNNETVETLYKVVKYFKDQNKTVYILGISYGAFVVQQLIATKGIDVADKYLIMVGRLDMNEAYWTLFSQGKGGHFTNGGLPIVPTEQSDVTIRNMYRLAAGIARNRFTQTLNSIPSLSRVTYVYGQIDDQVGKLTNPEIEFLHAKNATVISSNEGHSNTIDNKIVEGFKVAFGIE